MAMPVHPMKCFSAHMVSWYEAYDCFVAAKQFLAVVNTDVSLTEQQTNFEESGNWTIQTNEEPQPQLSNASNVAYGS